MRQTLAKFRRIARLGARSLLDHKLRSLLTALGIICGVGSVIAMLAIGEGASFEAREQIRRLGSNNVIVRAVRPTEGSSSGKGETKHMSVYGLTYDDAHRVQVLFPNVKVIVPARVVPTHVRVAGTRRPVRIVGTVPWFLANAGVRVRHGRFITDDDVRRLANVCVIGATTARDLFPLDWPLGRSLYVGSAAYTVVGVTENLAESGRNDHKERDVADVYVPLTTAQSRFGKTTVKRETGSFELERVELHQLTLTAESPEAVVPLANAVRTLLQTFHKQKDFEITIPLELLKQAEATKRIFNIVLGSIAAISLLVGGIGIMNIMLASVTERTREIGIRRALGATREDIVVQFLAEALILSLAGGLIGMGLGIGIPRIVTLFAHLRTIVTPESLILAFAISVATGLVFGIYPAVRAASMSPIEALRHE